MDFTEETASDAVVASFANTEDPRLRAVLGSLTRHLHDFVREVRPSHDEWAKAVDFLTEVGQTCDETRQEFILLSDVLGVSMLVETINGQHGGTENTVLGPFHAVESPQRDAGENIDLLGEGEPCVVTGRVVSTDGEPLRGASVDIWQCTSEGFYDVQQPDVQPLGNGRGLFRSDDDGRFWFRTVVPSHYPIPTDGPVGALLETARRHPYRPAHIHLLAEAAGHEPVTTHLFVADSPYIDSDAVFAVKQSLVTEFVQVDDEDQAKAYGVQAPFRLVDVEISLETEGRLA
ncbi:6-chlorohydroxyquinol-1,2-dioxygenase [Allosaccharopolyspora coralli]|uniref:6-chlorohydroxyquinol-1,2-dioxygenase n=1 Tax=Allosaccharopolyspora coralli TaxID=2665642 RepID=A0A5Q3QJI8_9PSEU|nr:dioxygenase [Allosaccharopolyspora coralli]QGK70997.1 6-chlorohydroxyquinol-1,2-dioxygenase [Allosaccharopolyspora coralli]